MNLTPLRGGLFLNYERRETTLKGSHLSFAFSRHLAYFVVQNTYCGQRPHQTPLRGFKELSTKAGSYTIKFLCFYGPHSRLTTRQHPPGALYLLRREQSYRSDAPVGSRVHRIIRCLAYSSRSNFSGSSIKSFTLARNPTASRPSMTRWS